MNYTVDLVLKLIEIYYKFQNYHKSKIYEKEKAVSGV